MHGGNYNFTGPELQSKLHKFLCIFFQQRFCFIHLFTAVASISRLLWSYLWEKSCDQSLSFPTCANNSRYYFASLTIGGHIWVLAFHTRKTWLFARHSDDVITSLFLLAALLRILLQTLRLPPNPEDTDCSFFNIKVATKCSWKKNRRFYYLVYRVY